MGAKPKDEPTAPVQGAEIEPTDLVGMSKEDADKMLRAYEHLEAELLAKEQEVEALRKQLAVASERASQDVPNVPLQVVYTEDGTATARATGLIIDPDVWAYSEYIGFAEDAGYSFDVIRDRAHATLHRALHHNNLGALERGGHVEFSKLPKFSQKQRLHLIVWIKEDK